MIFNLVLIYFQDLLFHISWQQWRWKTAIINHEKTTFILEMIIGSYDSWRNDVIVTWSLATLLSRIKWPRNFSHRKHQGWWKLNPKENVRYDGSTRSKWNSYMVHINSIQKLFKCLNPLMMVPYARNINRDHPVTLKQKITNCLIYSFKEMSYMICHK